ncbi:MAG TPA: S8 family serine peptidase, partial [Mycobacteriales bacterium]|nr:S8 family serine peptidase [Mycobacteriales bacterium]
MRVARGRGALLAGAVTVALIPLIPATATPRAAAPRAANASADPVLYPAPPGKVTDYSTLHLSPGGGACAGVALGADDRPAGSQLPVGFDCKTTTKLTDYAAQPGDDDYDPLVTPNPQELYGVKGAGTNVAWETTTGRPDTVIAELDSGIEWGTPELADKVELNRGELPPPCHTKPCDDTRGDKAAVYDANGDGVFSARDYTGDPRIAAAVPAAVTRGFIEPEDLIRTFSDGQDHDGNGYKNDIAGWDFYQHDNDPSDDVTYGHGTGEAKDSSAMVSKTLRSFSECPNCRVIPLRVGDSFIADVNHFAAAVIYAVDNGISVVQEALGTLNHSAFAQAAVDYAYAHGVLVVASEADEAAGHHNYPAALNRTMVVNSVTHYATDGSVGPVAVQMPKTYLAFNGCTNFGGYTWVSIESNSCSSDATGQAAGIAGLLYSAARNSVQHGTLHAASDGGGRPLSAEEAKQLFRLAADDIDFGTPKPPVGPPDNFVTTLPDSTRYITTAGWDQISGWGRLNAKRLVAMVHDDAQIPAEADITSPAWWTPLGTSGTVPVIGSAAAPRAASYTYSVQVAPGVQGAPYPATDAWTTVFTSGVHTTRTTGPLATIDLAQVRQLINSAPPPYNAVTDPTSRDLPEKDAFRVRVVVHPSTGPDGIEQRQYFSYDDPTRAPGWPRNLDADISAPAFADLTGDGRKEIIVGDGNGFVHAFRADGSEAPGFPVHTNLLDYLPSTGTNAFTTKAVSAKQYGGMLLGSPVVADLDGTGYPSVIVTDLEGRLYAWDHTGKPREGFPLHVNTAYSHDTACETGVGAACDSFVAHPVRDHINTVDRAFFAAPTVADLDPGVHDGLEILAGSEDGHLYAWHANGQPVAGFPVLLRDPSKVASVDPVSHRVTFKSDAKVHYGRQIVTSPTVALIDGKPRIFVNTDEEYEETPNISLRTATAQAIANAGILTAGNTRVYSVWPDGTKHPGAAKVAGLGDNAIVPGWPVKIADLDLELLPDVGSGSDGSPVVGVVNGQPEIATASIAGAVYLLKPDGSSALGKDPLGLYVTAAIDAQEFKGTATDTPSIAAIGGIAFGRLAGPAKGPSVAMGAAGLRRLLDLALPEQQLGAEDHIGAWDPSTGSYEPGFPALMNDLQFFLSPAIADVDGSGFASVIQSSAVYDTRAYRLGGITPAGWPKETGGWVTQTAGVADVMGSGRPTDKVQVVVPTREGNLFVWTTKGSACQPKEWPKFQHDAHNSGDYRTDATPPGVLRKASLSGTRITVTASGDDDWCATKGASYVVFVDGVPHALALAPAVAGTVQTLDVSHLAIKGATVSVSERDAAGNLSFPVVLQKRTKRAAHHPAGHPKPVTPPGGALAATGARGSLLWPALVAVLVGLSGFAAAARG